MKVFGILLVGFWLALIVAGSPAQERPGRKEDKKAAQADIVAGKRLFDAKCGVCHSTDGKETRVGPGLKGVGDGNLPSGRNATHDVILNQLNMGGRGLLTTVKGYGMPIFRELLTTKEKDQIIAYVMQL
jgi:mono/diheme cytochrome c family protein